MSSYSEGSSSQASIGGMEDPRPLTDHEVQQVKRLLSDPFSFPMDFKTWLVSYLETNPPTIPSSSVFGIKKIAGAGPQGPAGPPGATGPAGPLGPTGASGATTFVSGSGAPTAGLGNDGAIYLDYTNLRFYGPKASGAWPGTAFGHLTAGP